MRILGIETSSARGSVALIEDLGSVCVLEHQRENAHAEAVLPLIQQALTTAGWTRQQLDRIAVGIGPGSFTGLRVGIAIAQGLSEGLGIPLVGIPSLKAMAMAVPAELPGPRCVLVDARRGELFFAAYEVDGRERMAVQLVPVGEGPGRITATLEGAVYVGSGAALVRTLPNVHRSAESDQPHARWVALAARYAEPTPSVSPLYVRDAGAVIPALPSNPLGVDAR